MYSQITNFDAPSKTFLLERADLGKAFFYNFNLPAGASLVDTITKQYFSEPLGLSASKQQL